jgi:hypothetical protein
MTNKQIASAYLAGKTHGKANNIFIEGETIYSYGHHFPMAVRIAPDIYAWNEDRYSVTTSKHQGQCHPGLDNVIPCDTAAIKTWEYLMEYGGEDNKVGAKTRTIEYLKICSDSSFDKQTRARTAHMKAYWSREVARYDKAIKELGAI